MTSEDVGVWYHVYSTLGHPGTTALTFVEGWGSKRFAPIVQADGTPVHTCHVVENRLHGDRFGRARDVVGVHRRAVSLDDGGEARAPQPSANVRAVVPG